MKYEQIKEDLKHQIETYILKGNQVIPSENALCKQYNVSRITVRKAIEELCYEGLIYKIQGKGCFVLEKNPNKISNIYSFTEAITKQGKTPSKQLISFKKEKSNDDIAKKLNIHVGDEVYIVKCLYLADDKKYCLNLAILPEKLFPRLECFNLQDVSLYEILRLFYNISMTRVKQTITSKKANDEISKFLDVDENEPLLKIEATSYCLHKNNEVVFEIYESYQLTDVLAYQVEKFT